MSLKIKHLPYGLQTYVWRSLFMVPPKTVIRNTTVDTVQFGKYVSFHWVNDFL